MNEYIQGASLPDWGGTCYDMDGNIIDFSTGWTFTADLIRAHTREIAVANMTGFVGSATAPNLSRGWTLTDLDQTPGEYILAVEATRTADSKQRIFHFSIRITDPGTD